ncbi:MAG: hypothetical protein IKU18_03920, partial [Bacteroidales bacterium]|nr:hypothetical protein [Bacteroidales bacterium]
GLVRVVAEVGAGGYWCWGMWSGCRWGWWMVWNSFCIFTGCTNSMELDYEKQHFRKLDYPAVRVLKYRTQPFKY